MKKISLLFMMAILWSADLWAVSEWPSIHGEYALLGAGHWTGGSGDKTLLRKGLFLTNDLRLNIDQKLEDEWRWVTDIHLRKTSDPQIDHRNDAHLLGFTTEIYNPFLRFTAGDFFADFTQYTMGQSLHGFQLVAKNDYSELKLVAGYSQRAIGGTHFLRYVYGGRTETQVIKEMGFVKDARLGINFVGTEDDHSTIDPQADTPDASNRVGSVNGRVKLWDNTDVEGEIAKSWIDDSSSAHPEIDRKLGTALRLRSNSKFSSQARLKLGYEWASVGFGTLSGTAIPDKVIGAGRFDYKWNRELATDLSYRISYDKLDKSDLSKRTVTQTPHVGLNWTPDSENWLLKDFYMRSFWEMRSRVSQDDPSGQTDFASNEVGVENEFKVENVTFNSGWDARTESDDLSKINDRVINSGYFGLKMREKMGDVVCIPSLRYQFNYEYKPKEEGRDLTQKVTAGLNIDFGSGLRFEQRYSIETASRLAYDSDTLKSNVYLGLDYRIPAKQDLTLRITFERTDFAHPKATERFNENNLQTQLLWKF